jgi:cytochrome P450
MFRESFRTLEIGRKSEYSRILESVLQGAGIGAELPLLRSILRAIPNSKIREMFNGTELLRSYAEVAVRNSRQLSSKANVFATIIAEAEKGETEQLADLDVKLEAGGFIVAGSDTTGITLTYLI